MILIKNPVLIAIRNAFIRCITSFSMVRKAIAYDLAELTISYVDSSIVKKSSSKYDFKSGCFIPVCRLESLKEGVKKPLSAICQGTKHHLFLFVGNLTKAHALNLQASLFARQFDHSIIVHLVLPYHIQNLSTPFLTWVDDTHTLDATTTAILIRPDKYVAMVQSPLNWHQLRVYLAKIFRA